MNINYFFQKEIISPEHLVDEMQSVIDTKHGSLLKNYMHLLALFMRKAQNVSMLLLKTQSRPESVFQLYLEKLLELIRTCQKNLLGMKNMLSNMG